jgi:L-cysteine:1D-myo-inositol 2-amino-2-deoxy-alpha-D-glucopyranoside ligase
VQNVTDVDDPLLERAAATGEDWTALAERETALFREDMSALRLLPPAHYIGAVEAIPGIVPLVERLRDAGAAYELDGDVYFSVGSDPRFGEVSGLDPETMRALAAERGGDPERPGKKNPLDPMLWMAARPGEPSWDGASLGPGRPGWHIECAAISRAALGPGFTVQGGGSDLIFPHHEMCAGHAQVAEPGTPFARHYVHAGMVAYDGEKMSKSKGNLVFVSALRNSDVDPMAIRLTLLGHHYRSDWEWTDRELWESVDLAEKWRRALALGVGAPSGPVVDEVLTALADDLDAPRAVAAVDAWADATLAAAEPGGEPDAGATIHTLLDAALGLAL